MVPLKHALAMLVATLACIESFGCTSVPTGYAERFSTAVGEARAAGDAIVVDHLSIKRQADAVRALAIEDAPSVPVFDPSKVLLPEQTNREVLARMRAWEVLERYSNALVAIAQGEGSGLADETNALLQSVSALAGLSLPPGVGTLVDLTAGAMDREIQARKFVEAVNAADPLMEDLSTLLQGDTASYYSIRLVLYNRARDSLRDPAGDRLNRFDALAAPLAFTFDPNDTAPEPASFTDLVRRLNAACESLGIAEAELYVPAEPGADPYDAEAEERLLLVVLEAERAVEQQNVLDSELANYHETLTAYVVLVKQMRAVHASLRVATTSAETSLPDVNVLLDAAIRVRAAMRSSH